ncbi:hypothetical protein CGLO_03966 [Colletotrichum gloeosporioides Cg-14]|uniref:Uncharacterized protein n=1 Tax=Colletotrichum gloeosporioides (strain Cg-14) TaxID=1237896 RepID=T0KKF0_COLGC|nr:hypothetical protein CGLO_03966 [Colletotrichum gloeosporioides Cg-14]
MSGALDYGSQSARLREYGISDCSSTSDETVDPPSSPTPSVCPKLEHDNSRHVSISSTASVQSCDPSPVQMSVEAAGLDRQVERSGDDSSCVLVRELPVATEGTSNHKSRLLSLDHEDSASQVQCPSPVSPSHNLSEKVSCLRQKLKDRKRKVRALKRKLRRTSKALQAFLE